MDTTFILGDKDDEMDLIEELLQKASLPIFKASEISYPLCVSTPDVIGVECQPGFCYLPDRTSAQRLTWNPHEYPTPPEIFLPVSSLGQCISFLAKKRLLLYRGDVFPISPILPDPEDAPGTLFWSEDLLFAGWLVVSLPDFCYEIPEEMLYVAARDQCPQAAREGLCPCVDPLYL